MAIERIRITDDESYFIAGALRVAAEQYDADALAHKTAPPEGLLPQPQRDRIVRSFEKQAADARRLADMFEQGDLQ